MNQPTQPSPSPSLRVPRFRDALPCQAAVYLVITAGHVPMLLRVGRVRFQGDPIVETRRQSDGSEL